MERRAAPKSCEDLQDSLLYKKNKAIKLGKMLLSDL